MSSYEEVPLDSVVTAVIDMFKSRAAFGKQKYGTDLDRTDLAPLDWIQHAQEELMDAILYLQKLKTVVPKNMGQSPLTLPSASAPPPSGLPPSAAEILRKSLEGNGC
jgi:hypothetical protein